VCSEGLADGDRQPTDGRRDDTAVVN